MTGEEAKLWPRRYLVPACHALAGKAVVVERRERRKKDDLRPPVTHKRNRYGVAADGEGGTFAYLVGTTQYALRRGHMSVRLRAGEDAVIIASQCGTSVQMLHRHYAADIAEAGVDPRPLEVQLREALGWGDAGASRHLRVA